MPETVADQKAMTCLGTYEFAGPRHGLMIFKVEGANGELVTELARLWDKQVLSHQDSQEISMACRLWVGVSIPTSVAEWRLVEARLIECTPTPNHVYLPLHDYQTYTFGGLFIESGHSAHTRHTVTFRGKFMIAFSSHRNKAESQVGYVKLSRID